MSRFSTLPAGWASLVQCVKGMVRALLLPKTPRTKKKAQNISFLPKAADRMFSEKPVVVTEEIRPSLNPEPKAAARGHMKSYWIESDLPPRWTTLMTKAAGAMEQYSEETTEADERVLCHFPCNSSCVCTFCQLWPGLSNSPRHEGTFRRSFGTDGLGRALADFFICIEAQDGVGAFDGRDETHDGPLGGVKGTNAGWPSTCKITIFWGQGKGLSLCEGFWKVFSRRKVKRLPHISVASFANPLLQELSDSEMFQFLERNASLDMVTGHLGWISVMGLLNYSGRWLRKVC